MRVNDKKNYDAYKKMNNINNKKKLVKKDQFRCVCVKICFLAVGIINTHTILCVHFLGIIVFLI